MAHVMRFQPVHIRAVPMHRFPNAMTGAVKKVLAVTGFLDDITGRFVHLPALQRLSRSDAEKDQFDSFVARIPGHLENLRMLFRDLSPKEPDPSDIVVDAARR